MNNKQKGRFSVFVKVCLLALAIFAGASARVVYAEPYIERMSFIDANVGEILQSLGRLYGVSFSISSGAAAKRVSIEFANVSFQTAIEMIADAAGVTLASSGSGKKLYIVRSNEEERGLISESEREEGRKENKLADALVEVVSVKYVSVKDIEEAVKKTIADDGGSLVKISRVATEDKRNYNNLVITAANQRLMNAVKKVITIIDTPKPMVEIEVLFVELIRSNDSSTGIDWDVSTSPFDFSEEPKGEGEGFDPFKFGTFYRMTPWQAQAAVTALKGNSKSRVLADPKIRVMSGRRAVFSSETQVPILTRNKDSEINTEWKNVGINLEILPVVLDDGSVHLSAIPRASSITGEKRLGDVVAPIISERKAETEVLMFPGETMVIGGLMNDKEVRSLSKVPLLSDIPLLGALFKSERKENEKSTVVIFLRPHLVMDTEATGEAYAPKWKEKEKEVVKVFELNEQGESDALEPKGLSLDERIEALRKDVEEAERKKSEVAQKAKQKELVNAAPQNPQPQKQSAKTSPKAEPIPAPKPVQKPAPPVETKPKPEVKPAPLAEKEAPGKPAGEPRKWEEVGDIDEYLSNMLLQYQGKGSDTKEPPAPVVNAPVEKVSEQPAPEESKEAPAPVQKPDVAPEAGEWTPPME